MRYKIITFENMAPKCNGSLGHIPHQRRNKNLLKWYLTFLNKVQKVCTMRMSLSLLKSWFKLVIASNIKCISLWWTIPATSFG